MRRRTCSAPSFSFFIVTFFKPHSWHTNMMESPDHSLEFHSRKQERFCSEVERKSLFVPLLAGLKSTLLAANAENLNSFHKNRKKIINKNEIFEKITSTKFLFIQSYSISANAWQSFFIIMTSYYLLIVGAECYCCT